RYEVFGLDTEFVAGSAALAALLAVDLELDRLRCRRRPAKRARDLAAHHADAGQPVRLLQADDSQLQPMRRRGARGTILLRRPHCVRSRDRAAGEPWDDEPR